MEYFKHEKEVAMKVLNQIKAALCSSLLWLSTSAYADDAKQIIEKLQSGQSSIGETATPLLLPFAMEWDALASTANKDLKRAKPKQYQMLATPDPTRMKASMEALGRNQEAVKFFIDPKTIEAFNQTYQKAVDSGSSVGMIPHAQAMEYWVLSKTVTAGPEVIEAYPTAGNASPEWCLPPLIRCTPPRPAPQDK
jgi:hypothetical protein